MYVHVDTCKCKHKGLERVKTIENPNLNSKKTQDPIITS